MSSKCLHHSQHHCVHAHNCDNPLHKATIVESQSKQLTTNKKTGSISKAPTKQVCKSGTLKPVVGIIAQKSHSPINKHLDRKLIKTVSPDCKNLDYQRMFLNLSLKYEQLSKKLQALQGLKEGLEKDLQSERMKNVHMSGQVQRRKTLEADLKQLQGELDKLKQTKSILADANSKCCSLQGEVTRLKLIVDKLTDEKERIKQQIDRNSKKTGELQEDYFRENTQKDQLKRKLQESRDTIQSLQTQFKNMTSKSKGSTNQMTDQYEKKLRALDQKFSFSCDQVSQLKKAESKLKSKVKQLQQQLHQQKMKASSKSRPEQASKVEKELMSLQQKSSKQNQRLRQTIIDYEHEKRKVEEELSKTTLRLEQEVRQLQKLLIIKEAEIEELESIKVVSDKEAEILRQNRSRREKDRLEIEEQIKKTTIKDTKSKQEGPRLHQQGYVQPKEQNREFRGTFSQTIAIRHLQSRNTELIKQVQQLQLRVTEPGQTISINNYNEFEKVIKDNNQQIRDLIADKGREMESNSKLKVEVMQLKSQLSSRTSSTSISPQQGLQQQKIREAANFRNQVQSLRFQLQQIREQNFEINNRYSDYYIIREDNQQLRIKVEQMVRLIETLKRSAIHNSYQKEALISDNQQLFDQANLYSSLPRYY